MCRVGAACVMVSICWWRILLEPAVLGQHKLLWLPVCLQRAGVETCVRVVLLHVVAILCRHS